MPSGKNSRTAPSIEHVARSRFPEAAERCPIASMQVESRINKAPDSLTQRHLIKSLQTMPFQRRTRV
jgi:hypothetical protein